MKIRSAGTNNAWISEKNINTLNIEDRDLDGDMAAEKIQRVLSEIIRCQNLVVLSGLGTSLCVMEGEDRLKRRAPTMPDLWKRVRLAYDPDNKGPWEKLLELVRHENSNENIEELLSECKVAENFLRDKDLKILQNFIELAEKEIRSAVNFLNQTDALPIHGAFLQRIARRSTGKGRAKIFTTNYDLCFEHAAKNGRFVVIDGFSPTLPPTFDPVYFTYDIVRRSSDGDASAFIPNVFQLYKLHGSIDWERSGGEIEKKYNTSKPLLIYPRSSKYEQAFSQPYLEMMAAFQTSLREPNTGLLIVGFGFNDNHIAEPIMSAIRSNLGLKVVIVDPSLVKSIDVHKYVQDGGSLDDVDDDELLSDQGSARKNPFLNKILQMIDQGDARLTLLNGTFEDISKGIPDMAAETDLEKHMIRMRAIDGDLL
ncbi:SIR2 family protein [Polynucleobacter sp. 86C-FISCH]|uniref:SIR2 family protein n=1 Tax=Polynucleobacter sp. 86C-FISCH TaxID=2689101 RepID=UPI001ECAA5B2|nr:SIR2 family protein [Polynucleobacter sp. 86C-FISCH]MBU3594813.1 SIR2 family protein [Polynucleobacter sp. 86C-FISCH]